MIAYILLAKYKSRTIELVIWS